MVFSYQPRDIGANIGKGLGGAAGNVLQQQLQARALSGISDDIAAMEDRSPINLYSALQDRLKYVPGGEQYARQMLPTLIESARTLPYQQQAQPGQDQAVQQPQPGKSGLGQEISRVSSQEPMQQQAQPGQAQGKGMQPRPSPAQVGQLPQAEQLAQSPELTQNTDLDGLRAAYSAAPVFKIADHNDRIAEIMRTQQLPYTEAVQVARNEWEDKELRPFEQRREIFEKQEQRVDDAKGHFNDLFSNRFPAATAEERQIGDKILQSYASGTDAEGREYTPRIAAQKAIDELSQINKGINQAIAEVPLSFTDAAFDTSKKERVRRLKPVVERAKKYGIEKQVRDKLVANEVMTPAQASAMLWQPSREVVSNVDKIPKLVDKSWSPMTNEQREREARKRSQSVDMAANLITGLGANDSLVVLRDLLSDRGLDTSEFQEAIELAQEKGWNKSRLHEDEDQYLTRPVKYSLSDLWLGRTPSFSGFLRNFVFGER